MLDRFALRGGYQGDGRGREARCEGAREGQGGAEGAGSSARRIYAGQARQAQGSFVRHAVCLSRLPYANSETDVLRSLYVFELPRKADGSPGVLGLPVGQHVQIAVHFKDQAVLRSYTPVHPVLPHEEDGTIHLLVKTYMPSEDGPFPPGGTVSNYLDCMEDGAWSSRI